MTAMFRIHPDRLNLRPEPGSILVVDDSRSALHLIGRRLDRRGHRALLAENGAAALGILRERRCDLVLLDMVMPAMSGLHTLREIRALPAGGDVPVLMITARSDPGAVVEALAAGADDHIAKPFDFEALAARIDRQLSRAAALDELKRRNAALDARIADRAAENGELRAALAAVHADRSRLVDSLAMLRSEMAQLRT